MKGFTLVETLVVLGIVVLLSAALGSFGLSIFQQNRTITSELNAEGEAKIALARIITELRQAQLANNGAYLLEMASSTELVFYSDIDHDGVRERLNYFLAGPELKRGLIEPTVGEPYVYDLAQEKISVVIHDLINTDTPIFSYYDQTYNGTSTGSALSLPVDVKLARLVKINFLIDANTSRAPAPLSISGLVMIRNLKDYEK